MSGCEIWCRFTTPLSRTQDASEVVARDPSLILAGRLRPNFLVWVDLGDDQSASPFQAQLAYRIASPWGSPVLDQRSKFVDSSPCPSVSVCYPSENKHLCVFLSQLFSARVSLASQKNCLSSDTCRAPM